MKKQRKRANGQGSVYYNDRLDRYVGQITIAPGERKSFYGVKGDKSAKARLGVEERMRPFQMRRLKGGSQDVGGAVREFLATHKELAEKTVDIYSTAAKHIIGDPGDMSASRPRPPRSEDPISRKRLIDLEPTDVKAFYARLQTGTTMKSKVHILLHRVLQEAVELELIFRNPASLVAKPQPATKEMIVWSPQEVACFLTAARGHRLYALFVLALTSTMGPAELFALKRSAVNLQGAYVQVTRNLVAVSGRSIEKDTKVASRRRRIDLPAVAIDALRDRLKISLAEGHAGSAYVFTSPKGGPLRLENFRRRVWEPLLEKAALAAEEASRAAGDSGYRFPRITPYEMRHTANALMGLIGIPIAVASARMGHQSAKMTLDTYGHLYASMQQDAAAKLQVFFTALDLDSAGQKQGD